MRMARFIMRFSFSVPREIGAEKEGTLRLRRSILVVSAAY